MLDILGGNNFYDNDTIHLIKLQILSIMIRLNVLSFPVQLSFQAGFQHTEGDKINMQELME